MIDAQMSFFDSAMSVQARYDPHAELMLFPGDVNDLLKTVPDESVKLIVTSPPYNIGKEYEARTSIDNYLDKQATIIEQLHRTLRADGSICWQVGNYVDDGEIFPLDVYYYRIFKNLGMQLRNRIVWHFGHGLHASKRFSGRYEVLLWFTKSGSYSFFLDAVRVPAKYPGKTHFKGPNRGKPSGNPKGVNPTDVWQVMLQEWEEGMWDVPNCKSNHPEKTTHPAQFPIEVAERCVLALTEETDLVFDPFAGVGSSLIAALKNKRRAMGAEKEPRYLEVTRDRIARLQAGTLSMRKIGTPIFQPTGRERVSQIPVEWIRQEESL